jgi:hypothetical protein
MSYSCVGGDTSKLFDFQRATIASAAIAGELWIAKYDDLDFASVAAWFGPGRMLLDTSVSSLPAVMHSLTHLDQSKEKLG